jgi:hypothetical protein
MPFKSSEIRWFSTQKNALWKLYETLPNIGEGTREPDRTDYYLKSGTINTGIKIREGNHELKVKRGDDEMLDYGVMEHWIKWSTTEEVNILNTVDDELLGDWIAVKKKRFKKSYEIINRKKLERVDGIFPAEGCGAEFTEIQLRRLEYPVYTFGMEAFSSSSRERENLLKTIEILEIDFSPFKEFDSFGYPQLLMNLGKKSA